MIKINKRKEIFLSRKDVFILSTIPNGIVIDSVINASYNGIIILDDNLHKKDTTLLPQGEKLYDFYSFFKKFSQDEFLFYCQDSQGRMVHVNLKEKKSSLFLLDSSFDNIKFSPVYWWTDSLLLLSDYNGNFYQVLLDQKAIVPFEKSKLLDMLPDFFKFYQQVSKAWPQTIYPESYQYIFTNEDYTTITFVDFLKKNSISVSNPFPKAHDFRYKNGTFLSISEKGIGVISAQDSSCLLVKPSTGYYFMWAQLLNNTTFVTLSAHGMKSHITVYSIL